MGPRGIAFELLHELLNHSTASNQSKGGEGGGDFNLSMDRDLLRREVMVLVRMDFLAEESPDPNLKVIGFNSLMVYDGVAFQQKKKRTHCIILHTVIVEFG